MTVAAVFISFWFRENAVPSFQFATIEMTPLKERAVLRNAPTWSMATIPFVSQTVFSAVAARSVEKTIVAGFVEPVTSGPAVPNLCASPACRTAVAKLH
jgi:hypothetical protein